MFYSSVSTLAFSLWSQLLLVLVLVTLQYYKPVISGNKIAMGFKPFMNF